MSKKNKNKNNFNNNLLKKFGGNFVLWILIIVMSVSVLQYLTLNSRSIEITYTQFDKLHKNQYQNEHISNFLLMNLHYTYVMFLHHLK